MKGAGVPLLLALVLSACGSDDPQSQLREIEQLQAKGFPMTEAQKSEIAALVTEGSALLAAGQQEASSEKLARALEVLEQAADAERFNKSE